MQRGVRAPRPAEDDAPAVAAADGADPQVALGPGLPLDLAEHRQPGDDVEAAPGQQRECGDQRAEAPGAEQRRAAASPSRAGPAGAAGATDATARTRATRCRSRAGPGPRRTAAPDRPCSELGGRDAGAQQGAGDRPGGGPDDDVGGARVQAVVVLEHGQDAGVVGLSDDPAGAQDEPDTAHVPPSCARDHARGRAFRPAPLPAQAEGGSTQASRAGGRGHRPGMPGGGSSRLSAAPCPAAGVPPGWSPGG